MPKNANNAENETDLLRLNDLTLRHGLACRIQGKDSYYFDYAGADAFSEGFIFIARGLREALAFAEGFDRAIARAKPETHNAEELRKLGTFTSALRKSGLVGG